MTTLEDTPGVALASDRLIDLRPLSLTLLSPRAMAAQPGGFVTRRLGQGMEMADTRAYVAGDDIRHLDRAATARTGRLHIRKFQEERDRVSLLIADFRAPMFWGLRRVFRSVAAAEVLALIGWQRVAEGGRVGLLAITPSGPVIVPPRGRIRGMLDVIGGLVDAHERALDQIRSHPTALSLDQALIPVDRLVPSGAELVVASGFDQTGPGLTDRLDRLARRRRPRLVLVTAAEAKDLPAGRYPMRLDGQRRVQVALGSRGAEHNPERTIAGRAAVVVNASDPVQAMAARLAGDAEAA
ncbi:MAG: DUF58 domain-containing protein [Pseudomonadota bacterium]